MKFAVLILTLASLTRLCFSYRTLGNLRAVSYFYKAKILSAIQVDPNDPDFRATRVFVSGIPLNIDWMLLKDHFKKSFPEIVYASVSIDRETGKSKGCGLVQFHSKEEAERAIHEMNGSMLSGSPLHVRKDVQERRTESVKVVTPGKRERIQASRERKPKSKVEHINERWQKRAVKDTVIKDHLPKSDFLNIPYSFDQTSEIELDHLISENPEDTRQEKVLQIQQFIIQREEYRKEKKFEEADRIRSMMLKEFRVQCDDSKRMWRVLAH